MSSPHLTLNCEDSTCDRTLDDGNLHRCHNCRKWFCELCLRKVREDTVCRECEEEGARKAMEGLA